MIKTEAVINSNNQLFMPYLKKERLSDLQGKRILVTIEEYPEEVTPAAHGYYRLLNKWLAENTETFGGWLTEDIHDFARSLFLNRSVTFKWTDKQGKVHSEHKEYLESTSRIGKKKMAQFVTNWRDWLLAEQNIETPEAEHFKDPIKTEATAIKPNLINDQLQDENAKTKMPDPLK